MRMAHRYATTGLVVAGLLATVPVRTTAQEPSFRYQLADHEAYDNGFRDGLRHGEEDALNRRAYSFRQYLDYRDANLGYRPGDIELSEYQRAFREGFAAGYADAYDRTERGYPVAPVAPRAMGRIPASPPVEEFITPAGQFGFRDGYDAGVKDARDRETYDPVRSDRYRDADHHYNNRYGSKEVFKRDYRVGFERGYEQGYRVGR